MTPDLESLLTRLVALTDAAQRRWEAELQDDDEEWEPNPDEEPWLALEYRPYDTAWRCGWCVQPDEATEWCLSAEGATPTQAAAALLVKMEDDGR